MHGVQASAGSDGSIHWVALIGDQGIVLMMAGIKTLRHVVDVSCFSHNGCSCVMADTQKKDK